MARKLLQPEPTSYKWWWTVSPQNKKNQTSFLFSSPYCICAKLYQTVKSCRHECEMGKRNASHHTIDPASKLFSALLHRVRFSYMQSVFLRPTSFLIRTVTTVGNGFRATPIWFCRGQYWLLSRQYGRPIFRFDTQFQQKGKYSCWNNTLLKCL